MTALEKLWARLSGHASDAPENGDGDGDDHEPREMTGLYAQLTPEQRSVLCNYDGPVNSGGDGYPRNGSKAR
jgi:hypothetical protein